MKCRDTIPIEKDERVRWKVKVHLTFAPADVLEDWKKKDENKVIKFNYFHQ
jgi:hypothetical protein